MNGFAIICAASGLTLQTYPTREIAEYNAREMNFRWRSRRPKAPRYVVRAAQDRATTDGRTVVNAYNKAE